MFRANPWLELPQIQSNIMDSNDRRSDSHADRRSLDLFAKTSGDFERGRVGVRVN
jgi:hypothetical protein